MRNTAKPAAAKRSVDLAAAVRAVADHEPQALTLEELLRAYDVQHCAAESFRLRKWLPAFGHMSAWEITSDQLSAATARYQTARRVPGGRRGPWFDEQETAQSISAPSTWNG